MLLAGPARAGGRVAVVAFQVLGLPEQAERFRSSLLGGFEAAGLQVVPQAEIAQALSSSPGLANCDTNACLRRIAQLVNARFAARGTVEVVGSAYTINIFVVPSPDGAEIAASEQCTPCTQREAFEATSNAAQALKPRLEPPPPPALAPPPQPAVPPPATHIKLFRGGGVALGVLGLGALVAGAVEVARDNSCDLEIEGRCVRRVNTTGGQALSFVGAAVFFGGAAALSYFGWRHPPRYALLPALAPGAATLTLVGAY
jgi:hypothetical protein